MHSNLSSMTDQDRMTAGAVKAIRQALGLSLDGLARFVGMSKSTLHRIESGQRPLYDWEGPTFAKGAAQAMHAAEAATR